MQIRSMWYAVEATKNDALQIIYDAQVLLNYSGW